MKIKLLTGDDKTFMTRTANILDLYQAENGTESEPDFKIKRMLIIYGANDSGGLLLDYHHRDKNPFYRLMFAAFEKNNRNKGLLKLCLEFAKNQKINIALVEFDNSDQIDMWGKFGYSNPTLLDNGSWLQIMSNVDLKTLNQ